MSRLSTRDGEHGYGNRSRSGSPSEFFRHQIAMHGQMADRVDDLNFFIHQGIEKFLDKQAVLNLIHEYDQNDILVGGEEHFYQTLWDDQEVSARYYRFVNLVDRVRQTDTVVQTNQKPTNVGRMMTRTKRSPSTISQFITLIWVKIFNIKLVTRVKQRRASSMLENDL